MAVEGDKEDGIIMDMGQICRWIMVCMYHQLSWLLHLIRIVVSPP